jgi:hypothetical protein
MLGYEYGAKQADLTNNYERQNAAQDFGRFLGQQRFKRNREDLDRGFQRQFPKFTGYWAGRLGSGVQSGVMRRQLGEQVGDFNRRVQDVDVQESQFLGADAQQRAQRAADYERALLGLREQFDVGRGLQAPVAQYGGGTPAPTAGAGAAPPKPDMSVQPVKSVDDLLAEYLGYRPLSQSDARYAELSTPVARSKADPLGWGEIDRLQRLAAAEGRQFDPNDPLNWANMVKAQQFLASRSGGG